MMIFNRQHIAIDAALKHQVNKTGPIGMDIGTHAIHLCQVQLLQSRRFAIIAKVSIPFEGSRKALLDSPKRFKKLLARGMKQKGFIGKRIVTVMPADEIKIMPITYKAKSKAANQEIIKVLSGRINGNMDDYIIDYMRVRSNPDDEENLALTAIAQRDDVLHYLRSLSQSGFEVDALDVGPAAIRRLICTLYGKDTMETVLVINAGMMSSYLTIISGRRLLFDQQVSFGETQLIDILSNTLELEESACRELLFHYGLKSHTDKRVASHGLSEEEIPDTLLEILKPLFINLVNEINRILTFTASQTHGSPISRFCLLGSIARWPGVESLLRELIDIPFATHHHELAECFLDRSAGDERWSSNIPELAVATGLALRGLDSDE
jgi:type IV pilus assembly protein PilM